VFFAIGMELTDRPYVPLPLYHTAGGILGVGNVLLGLTVVIKKKFSVSSFWKDCIKYDCTVLLRFCLHQRHHGNRREKKEKGTSSLGSNCSKNNKKNSTVLIMNDSYLSNSAD